jgi:RsmE family RNA methyltransferase
VNLVIVEPAEVRSGDVHLAGPRADHLLRVLKVSVGQAVRVGVLDGPLGVGTVLGVGAATVDLRCVFEAEVPERPPVDLLLAVPRPKVMRRLWAQLSAIGVGHVVLTNAERVERDYFDAHVLAFAHYRPLLIEGLQQARDTRLPRVSIHRRFRVLVEDDLDDLFSSGIRLVAHPAASMTVAEAICADQGERVVLAVGPEGGWNAFELELLGAHGFVAVGAGPRTLRTDTACVALTSLAHDALRARARPMSPASTRADG